MRGTGASNTDSELLNGPGGLHSIHSRPGPTGIGQGTGAASRSLAER